MEPILFDPIASPYLVPFDGSFRVAESPTKPPKDARDKSENQRGLDSAVKRIRRRQRKLYADNRYSLLVIFQAMDAAGKDGTIRAVMTGINPAGCQVFSFKQPSHEELDHDFLWRVYGRLPERGRIGIFNRSHYEEVLVVRVHPHLLEHQRLPRRGDTEQLWQERLESIHDLEHHLARNGTAILKFWLNVSRDEQRERFLERIEDRDANWKFSAGDIKERAHWDSYMNAYEQALGATSRPWAPWYAIPADNKPYMRKVVAETIAETLKRLEVDFPAVSDAERAEMLTLRDQLAAEDE